MRNKLISCLLAVVVVAVGLGLIGSLAQELSTPNYGFRGTHYDFLAFYTAGQTAWHHNVGQLYDPGQLTDLQRQIIPHPVGASGYMPFYNPPFIAVLLAPLSLFSITTARLIWLGLSLGLAIFILYQLTEPLWPKQRYLAIGLLLLTFPMYQTLIEGQLTILVLLGGCLSYIFFKRHNKLLSGASLVLLWALPQFGLVTLIGLLIKRQWQMLKAWALASAAVGLAALPLTGLKIYFTYVQVLASATGNHFTDMNTSTLLTWRGAVNLTMGINGFFSALIGENHLRLVTILYLLIAAALVASLIKIVLMIGPKCSREQAALLFSATVLTAVLIDPHLYAQGIIILFLLLPAIYVLYKRNTMLAIICLAALCDMVLLDQYSRFHFFTFTALGLTVYALVKATRLPN